MRSTVIKKVIMAVTGLVMIGFLLVHMYGNLKMFVSFEAYDHYAHWLKGLTDDGGIMAPIMPAGQFIWVFRFALLAAIVLHIWSAASLSRDTIRNRGDKYVNSKRLVQTYSARTMRWGGVIIAFFVVFHLLQFTIVPKSFGGDPHEPHTMVMNAFLEWWMVAFYALCMVLICMHVRHGVWSALTTLGANTSTEARKVLNLVAIVVAVVLYVGFMIMPLAILFGVIK
ncbi:MAG: succinate dehydrogenase cytochrome b subunit [Tessaracoccus sp.]|uniref:succinate dehydrogenase cytochrome b subunit n=1 Tax=Tessaracoccus sp. TaxID=1971211 RepID=UPI001ECC17E0|nr:succinate dehydrogenase cytochrome b subunit [Tessaracoccus sp.]